MKLMSARVIPARFSARGMETSGPSPITLGSTAASAKATTEKRGVRPNACALSRVVRTIAQAASPIVHELPAVTAPSS